MVCASSDTHARVMIMLSESSEVCPAHVALHQKNKPPGDAGDDSKITREDGRKEAL